MAISRYKSYTTIGVRSALHFVLGAPANKKISAWKLWACLTFRNSHQPNISASELRNSSGGSSKKELGTGLDNSQALAILTKMFLRQFNLSKLAVAAMFLFLRSNWTIHVYWWKIRTVGAPEPVILIRRMLFLPLLRAAGIFSRNWIPLLFLWIQCPEHIKNAKRNSSRGMLRLGWLYEPWEDSEGKFDLNKFVIRSS